MNAKIPDFPTDGNVICEGNEDEVATWDGMANGVTDGVTDAGALDMTDCVTDGVTDAGALDVTDCVTGGVKDGVTDGVTDAVTGVLEFIVPVPSSDALPLPLDERRPKLPLPLGDNVGIMPGILSLAVREGDALIDDVTLALADAITLAAGAVEARATALADVDAHAKLDGMGVASAEPIADTDADGRGDSVSVSSSRKTGMAVIVCGMAVIVCDPGIEGLTEGVADVEGVKVAEGVSVGGGVPDAVCDGLEVGDRLGKIVPVSDGVRLGVPDGVPLTVFEAVLLGVIEQDAAVMRPGVKQVPGQGHSTGALMPIAGQ